MIYDKYGAGADLKYMVIMTTPSNDQCGSRYRTTAIAFRLSSLTLPCEQFVNKGPSREYNEDGRSKIIKAHFKDMLAENSDKYIMLEKFAGVDKRLKGWTNIFAEEIIEKYFTKSEKRYGY